MNDIYIIKSDQKTFFLRISLTEMHEQQDYEEEMSVINSLSENGINVAAPIRCEDGSFVWPIRAPEGIRYAMLFFGAEMNPVTDSMKMGRNLGQLVAKMHTIADEKSYIVNRNPIDFAQLINKPLKLIQPYLEHRSADYIFLNDASDELSQAIDNKKMMQPPFFGFCHGDVHAKNVCFKENKPTLFDFDCMGYGWRSYDICVFAWYETLRDEKYIDNDAWKYYIEGYNSIRQLSEDELISINAFSALREIWVMGHHADLMTRNEGCGWYNDGYFDFHIGIFKLWYNRFLSKK
jgi:Ser/Thr protein kinase RdoA (MazF antagonist)